VRDHVRAFGGSIEVLESPEGGARFRILLPLVDEEPS
jgi:signal transduction histidine kinase